MFVNTTQSQNKKWQLVLVGMFLPSTSSIFNLPRILWRTIITRLHVSFFFIFFLTCWWKAEMLLGSGSLGAGMHNISGLRVLCCGRATVSAYFKRQYLHSSNVRAEKKCQWNPNTLISQGPNYLSLMSHNQQISRSPSGIPQPVWLRGGGLGSGGREGVAVP